ncbi:biopolymer transporter ExbD [candidate division KSB1 bacterium]|nr:MAG: biopolymer transporter ExbD [candidate division KSB1 bacterium]RKY83923.1 MAG: biopolymer transporter ExbD [candidate division KSB1 bacterium]HDI51635.1 biopolymer transporter ExbD [Bacteroidota bacterium]
MKKRKIPKRKLLVAVEPDLTPLIDCVFMLLIFFMVTTVFIKTKGLMVDLPKATAAEQAPGKDINVVIEKDGTLVINGEKVAWSKLDEALKTAKENLKSTNVVIQADRQIKHKLVVKVVDSAKGQGIEGIVFATEIGAK